MYTEVRFYLANSLTPDVVTNAKYVVYSHECTAGLYIGYTLVTPQTPLDAGRNMLGALQRRLIETITIASKVR